MANENQLSITINLVRERETTNTVRFAEEVAEGDEPVIRTLYVQKAALDKRGVLDAETLTVQIDIDMPDDDEAEDERAVRSMETALHALGGSDEPYEPTEPPLTRGEVAGFQNQMVKTLAERLVAQRERMTGGPRQEKDQTTT